MSKVGAIFLFENTWKGVPFVHFPFSFSKNAAASWMLLQEVCTKHDLQSGSRAAPKRKHYDWEIYTLQISKSVNVWDDTTLSSACTVSSISFPQLKLSLKLVP